MDIFNVKKVADLERKLADAEKDRDKYKKRVAEFEDRFEKMGELEESIPSDCVRGPWCKACEFVKTFHVLDYLGYGQSTIRTAYVCGKGKSCNNFVQKETNNG